MAEKFYTFSSPFENVFRTAGEKRSPNEVDIAAPASPVIDLSRMNQRGVYLSTFLAFGVINGDSYGFESAKTLAQGIAGTNVELVDVWLVAMSCLVLAASSANFTQAQAAVKPAVVGAPALGAPQFQPIAKWTGVLQQLFAAGSTQYAVGVDETNPFLTDLPFLLRPSDDDCGIYCSARGTAVTTVYFPMTFWVGPRGSTPPGMP